MRSKLRNGYHKCARKMSPRHTDWTAMIPPPATRRFSMGEAGLTKKHSVSKGKSMPHKADRCFSCKQPYKNHNAAKGVKCDSFEFVAYSARNDRDILFSAPFQSDTSAKVYAVIAWKQGDYSCNCLGFRNHRKCNHVEQVTANPNAYKGKALQVQGKGPAGIAGEVSILQSEIEELENAVRDGRDADISMLAAKIEVKKLQLEAAGTGLAARFEKMQQNIRNTIKRDLGMTVDTQPAEIKSEIETVVDADDPFGNL